MLGRLKAEKNIFSSSVGTDGVSEPQEVSKIGVFISGVCLNIQSSLYSASGYLLHHLHGRLKRSSEEMRLPEKYSYWWHVLICSGYTGGGGSVVNQVLKIGSALYQRAGLS